MLAWRGSLIGGPVIAGLIKAYKTKLDASNTKDRIAADLAAKEIEAEIAARKEASAIIIAEQGRWYTAIIRPMLALPVMASTLWMLRRMAPTKLTLAGAAAGLTAGAVAAFVYAFSCDESAMPFVLIWYGIGMALPTAAGALLGRAVLRW